MTDGAYVQGAWGKGPDFPHPPARADLLVEPKLTTFTKNLHWEASTRASSQATLDRWHANVATQRSPFATLGSIVTNPASPYANSAEQTPPTSPSSTTWGKTWGTMTRSASASQIDLANIARMSRNLHSFQQPENYLTARGWTSKPGTHSQIFRPKK
eukprot:gb/GFBE01045410.1/.p1 GENE.gb/GFBE01045410.1/~~gb/GFBE01045410.1/.p1  ORF type:complete len:157 (+),score=12.12 gb/GFBE01045410.1/:1-471(+)